MFSPMIFFPMIHEIGRQAYTYPPEYRKMPYVVVEHLFAIVTHAIQIVIYTNPGQISKKAGAFTNN